MSQGGARQVLNLCFVGLADTERGKLTFTFIGTVSRSRFPRKLVEAGATAITWCPASVVLAVTLKPERNTDIKNKMCIYIYINILCIFILLTFQNRISLCHVWRLVSWESLLSSFCLNLEGPLYANTKVLHVYGPQMSHTRAFIQVSKLLTDLAASRKRVN